MKTFFAGAAAAPLLGIALAGQASAQSSQDIAAALQRLEGQVASQSARIAEQGKQIAQQRAVLEAQRTELDRLILASEQDLAASSGAGIGHIALLADPVPGGQVAPVGEAPPETPAVEIESLPEGAGVLTPAGHFVIDQSLDYIHGSSNRLVFRGVEIVTGIQIGVIEASDADRTTLIDTFAFRYGLTPRIEVELRAPYVYRHDRITTLTQREETATRSIELEGKHLGDIELSSRYQFNSGAAGRPIFIGSLRVKSDTGSSPFEIPRDEFGVATSLATGSGFWAVEPALNFIYATDPAVLFGSISYLAHLPRDIDQIIGEVFVGRVDPGDAITGSLGFGFALNQRFSFSLGYKHTYIRPTVSRLGETLQKSESLQVGAFGFGWSYRLSDQITFTNGYEIGATADSPDMRVVFRLPIRF